jgi:CRP-like cAMP-binding protein
MLEFTRLAETRLYPAGAAILSPRDPAEYLFMIQSGEVEVIVQDRRKKETVLSHLKQGEFFGGNEVFNEKKSAAHVRAGSEGPVEVLTIRSDDFKRVMDESPLTAGAVGKIVQERSKLYQAADHRKFNLFSLFRKP